MRVCHVESAVFDDPNLVSCGGLAPVVALAQRCGLAALAGSHLSLSSRGGANAPLKVSALVAGMVVGADSIADMDVLRHGGMPRLFDGVRAPSTLGRSCARSLSVMSVSSTRLAPACWPGSPPSARFCLAPTCWRSSTSTTR